MIISHKSRFGASILQIVCAGLLLSVSANAGVYAHYSFDADYSDSSANMQHGTLVDTETLGNSGIVSSPGSFKFGGGANRAEFIAGTRPVSGDSLFRAWLTMAGPGEGSISYPTSRSRTYGVEKYSEEDGTWKTELPAVQGSGDLVLRLLNTSRVREFYRVRVELP